MNVSEPDSTFSPFVKCQVCKSETNGKRHYGAIVCRACAAFFRRAGVSKKPKTCKLKKQCEFLKDEFFSCKYCRLQKCLKVGMSTETFEYDHDGYNKNSQVARIKTMNQIPPTMDIFCGRSNVIIFRAPSSSDSTSKPYIDLTFLLEKVLNILKQGPETTPLFPPTTLGKLAISLRSIQASAWVPDFSKSQKFGKELLFTFIENDILKVTKWLIHFEEFRNLPNKLQLLMIQGVWDIWWKLEKISCLASRIKQNIDSEQLRKLEKDAVIFAWDSETIDMSWCSKYSVEELKFFIDIPTEVRLDDLMRAMIELDPSDVELSFMLGQLCFQYVGKKLQGEILRVADKFQEILANDLHDYYVNHLRQPNYTQRLISMMKINNQIQKEVYISKSRQELARVFDVFSVEVSHPELFFCK